MSTPNIRPGIYFLPVGSFDPSAPTMRDLEQGIELTLHATDGYTVDAEDSTGEAAPDWDEPEYVLPPPKPWVGNIATQKRRRRL